MRRLLLAFAILAVGVALNGCAAVKVEVDDAHKGYVIYSNGKKVCDDSRNCYVPVARGDEMYLEAEKNGVVYGEVVIHRGDGGYSTQTVLHRGLPRTLLRRLGCHWALLPGGCSLWKPSPRLRNISQKRS